MTKFSQSISKSFVNSFSKIVSLTVLSFVGLQGFAINTNAQNSQVGYVESIIKNLSCGEDTITVNGWSSTPSVHLYLNTTAGTKYITETVPNIERSGLPDGAKGFSLTVNGSGLGVTPGPKIGYPVAFINQATTMRIQGVGGPNGPTILNPTSDNIVTKKDGECTPNNTKITNYSTTTASWDWNTKKWNAATTGGSPMNCSQTGAECDKLLAGVQNKYVFMWKYDYKVLPNEGTDPVAFATKNLPDVNVRPNVKGIGINTTFVAFCGDNSSVQNSYSCPNADWKWVWLDENKNVKSAGPAFPKEIFKWNPIY